ncbi:MAG: enoyl-CoA hydratase/isomerase family protein [Candidatus Omnitrophica bacterium]|nr:enoyl-CoA hydratase/isomerase family protein [Candidatus Omnitrophota bacterium]
MGKAVFYHLDQDVATIEFNDPQAKVNVLTADVLRQFNAFVTQAQNDAKVKVLIIRSGKKDVFIAGADIKEIEGINTTDIGMRKAQYGQNIFNHLEDLNIPTVAVIDGVALGGGCELALACKYRIATFNEKVKIGLPEVNLGILPGFGGTYRLPHLLGITQALTIILGAKVVSGGDALKMGLIDRLLPQVNLDEGLCDFVNQIKDSAQRKALFHRRSKGLKSFMDNNPIGHVLVFEQAARNVRQKTKGFYPSPLKVLELMKETFMAPREKALELEAKAFGHLVVGDVCKNLIKVFYLTEHYRKWMPPQCADLTPRVIQKCGVLGAGVMGGGIAQILSYYDMNVRVKDINFDALAKGLQAAAKIFNQMVQRKKMKPSQATAKMLKIGTTLDYTGFADCDCVIEAVVENMEVKKKVFAQCSQNVAKDALLFTNTSALSVNEMAQAVNNPSRFMGFHFFNPVHRMPLVELITGKETSWQTIADALALVRRMGKTPILVKDSPGFLINRILLAYINEAGFLLQEGVPVSVIDQLMTDFGMPVGPLALSDEVGLDVGIKVLYILQQGLGERFKPAEIFVKVFERKLLGKKSGSGFYVHRTGGRSPNKVIESLCAIKPVAAQQYKELRDRLLLVMINEAARCLEDKIVDQPGTIDVGMILGTGFPPFHAGLLHYADQYGISNIIDALNFFKERLGVDRFTPADYLKNLHLQKTGFYSGKN